MRAFLSVELPEAVRAVLAGVQGKLAESGADVKWTAREQLHVTMRFLGELTDAQRRRVEDVLGPLCGRQAPVRITLSSIGAFPSVSAPRVLWAGVGDGADNLAWLAERIEEGLRREFPQAERGFVPHITLGRVRSPRGGRELTKMLRSRTDWTLPEPFTADHLTLFQSVLSSSGPIHTGLAVFPFTAAPSA